MKKIVSILLAFGIALFGVVMTPQGVFADTHDDMCADPTIPQTVKDGAGCPNADEPQVELPNVVQNIVNVVIGITGTIALIMMIIGGINYMTAQGDAGKLKKAKDTIIYSAIGLGICILAAAIVNFVIGMF